MKRIIRMIVMVLILASMIFSACNALEGYKRTRIIWYVGLGVGTESPQVRIQKQIVDEFNKSQDKIFLVLEVVPNQTASSKLATQIASGSGPDVVGPVGWNGSNAFYGQWVDMTAYIEESNYDTSAFNKELVKFYQTEEGQVGLPFAVYPAMVFYNKKMFDTAGLHYPPARYGEKYKLPDGTEAEWSWDTLTQIAKLLTLDQNGRNATEANFDRENIVQYGYYPQYQDPAHMGAFWGADPLYEEVAGKPVAKIPAQWAAAWKWYFDGMWGAQPFIPIASIAQDVNRSGSDPFSYRITAMAVTQLWYMCCIDRAEGSWDIAALPSYQGTVHGRVDADTFRILKSSKNPEAAFEVVTYLIGPASMKLLETYAGMPARTANQDTFFDTQKEKFPWVTNWEVMQAGLSYPDIPSAEGYMPNWQAAYTRLLQFGRLLATDSSTNFDAEMENLEIDLDNIFQKK